MNKRGVVSISTFSFIILILIGLFGTTYYFYGNFKENLEVLNKETELMNSISSFRSEILNLILVDNSYLNYTSEVDNQVIILNVKNSSIYGKLYFEENVIEKAVSCYGVQFCSNYSFSTTGLTQFYYDGNCISVLVS